jgi:integrase/recombinase XerD
MTEKPKQVGNLWRVDFRVGDERHRRNFASEESAQNYIDSFLEQPAGTLEDTVRDYLTWSDRIKRKSPTTMTRDRRRFRIILLWAASAKISRVDQLDAAAVRGFQEWFYQNAPFDKGRVRKRLRPLNIPANWEKYRQNLSSLLLWCVKRGLAKGNPAADPDLKTKIQKTIPPHFRPEELAAVFGYFDNRDRDLPVPYFSIIFRLLAYTGMRLGEAVNLRWRDVDLKRGFIHVIKSKSKNVRAIPISDKLKPWLQRLPAGERLIDDGDGGQLYTGSWLLRQLHDACDAVKIPRRRVHDFRHTFAAGLARQRVSLVEIQRLMGHESITSTLVYIIFAPDDLRRAVESLDY